MVYNSNDDYILSDICLYVSHSSSNFYEFITEDYSKLFIEFLFENIIDVS